MTADESAPLLLFEQARLSLPDRTRLPPLDAVVQGRRLGLVGAWGSFFRLLTGEVRLDGGAATLRGVPAPRAVAQGAVGIALFDPVLAPTWTPERYLTESAALLGHSQKTARSLARELLLRFELGRIALRPLGGLALPERRAFLIAHATLGDPPVVCCEAPLARLDEPAQAYVEDMLERALHGRSGIVSVGSLPPVAREHALLERCDHVLALAHGRIVASGPALEVLRPSARVLATVTRHGAAFQDELRARGLSAEPFGHVDALLALVIPGPLTAIERFIVDLPAPSETSGVIDAALAADAPLVELSSIDPLGSAAHELPFRG